MTVAGLCAAVNAVWMTWTSMNLWKTLTVPFKSSHD